MKTRQMIKTEIDVATIIIDIPLRYGDEDVPYDFPLREGDKWRAFVEIDTGRIGCWPLGLSGRLSTKVCDEGTYTLLTKTGTEIARRQDYVPNGIVPGEYGDYIDLDIDENGIIKNWPKNPNVDCFFNGGDE